VTLELELAHDTLSTRPAPSARRIVAQPEAVQEHGVAPLEDFDVADARVRDVCMHARCPIPAWTRARAACDGLCERDDEEIREV
jgi:hypothetical protein